MYDSLMRGFLPEDLQLKLLL